jgi:hypothetical protein
MKLTAQHVNLNNHIMKKLLLFLVCGLMLHACSKDDLSTANSEQQAKIETSESLSPRTAYYLFAAIEVTTNTQGDYEFVENISTVGAQLDEILIDSSEILLEVDTFGFDFDTSGVQYFFASDYDTANGTLSVFVNLDAGANSIFTHSGGGENASGVICENKHCCEKCVYHTSLICPCHRAMPSCYLLVPPPVPSCMKSPVVIKA